MDIHSYIKYTVHRGLPLYAVIPVALPSIVSIQVNPRPYNGEVTSYYLLSQISYPQIMVSPLFRKQTQQELGQELAKFQSEQALKNVQKLPCSTEQKLELVDAAVKHLKVQQ